MKDQLEKKLQLLNEQIINSISDFTISQDQLMLLYEQKRFLRFKLHNYSNEELLVLSDQIFEDDFKRYKKASQSRTGMKLRIKKKLYTMIYPVYITITFTDSALFKDYRDNLRKLFKYHKITNYTLVTDYGTKTDRLHFHGFIDISEVDPLLFTYFKTGYYGPVFNFDPLTTNYGWNTLNPINVDHIDRAVNYITKYMVKDYKLKHSSFNSRNGNIKRSKEQFIYDYKKYLKKKNSFKLEQIINIKKEDL
jgi:hypothetical protein